MDTVLKDVDKKFSEDDKAVFAKNFIADYVSERKLPICDEK